MVQRSERNTPTGTGFVLNEEWDPTDVNFEDIFPPRTRIFLQHILFTSSELKNIQVLTFYLPEKTVNSDKSLKNIYYLFLTLSILIKVLIEQ